MKTTTAVYAAFACLLAAAASPAAAQSLVIGGWDSTRGGAFSLAQGSSVSNLRAAITAAYPEATITATPTLTTAYLDSLNILFISAITGEQSAIKPLTAAEQKALHKFFERGGIALIIVDYAPRVPAAVSNSMLSTFGLQSTGEVDNYSAAAVAAGTPLPVLNGPFENITTYNTTVPGWFNYISLATVLATLTANNEPALVYYTSGSSCALRDGVVIASADSSLLDNAYAATDDVNLVLNAIAIGIPLTQISISGGNTPVVGGTSTTGTVTLGLPAPGNGVVVTLTSANPAVAAVPASVTVPTGATSVNFTITTSPVTAQEQVIITATDGPDTQGTNVIVNPVTLQPAPPLRRCAQNVAAS